MILFGRIKGTKNPRERAGRHGVRMGSVVLAAEAEAKLRAIAGKAMADDEFRQKLLDYPKATVKYAGKELDDRQMKALMEMEK